MIVPFFIYLSMKIIYLMLLSIYFLLFVFFYNNVVILTKEIFINFIKNIIPALLPLIFLMNLLINCKIINKFLIKKTIIKELFLIVITIMLGAPACLNILNGLEKTNAISKYKKTLLVSCFGSFSFSYLGFLFFDNRQGIMYFIFLIISELIIYFIFNKKEYQNDIDAQLMLKKSIINKSIIDTVKTLIFILFSTLFMNLLFSPIMNVFQNNSFLIMLFEFSFSGSYAKNLVFPYKNLVLLINSGITSISIYWQLYYFDSEYDLYAHIKKRTYIALFSTLLFIIFFY